MTNEELDVAVAKKVMGYIKEGGAWRTSATDHSEIVWMFHPSTRPDDTDRLMHQMTSDGWMLKLQRIIGQWLAEYRKTTGDCPSGIDPDWKRAVCLAAVEAFACIPTATHGVESTPD